MQPSPVHERSVRAAEVLDVRPAAIQHDAAWRRETRPSLTNDVTILRASDQRLRPRPERFLVPEPHPVAADRPVPDDRHGGSELTARHGSQLGYHRAPREGPMPRSVDYEARKH